MRLPCVALGLLLAIAVTAAACGDATDEPAESPTTTSGEPPRDGDPTTTTTAPAPTASFRGVTEDTVRVGVMALDYDALASFGVRLGRSNSADLYVAALEEINDRGGVFGRRLEPVVTYHLPLGDQPYVDACTRLTEDEEVFVAIGQSLDDQVLCFTQLNDTAAITVFGITDAVEARSSAPLATIWASLENQAAAAVEQFETTGVLDGATVGVVGSAAVSEVEWRTIVDAFTAAGHPVVEGLLADRAEDLTETQRDQFLVYERMAEAGVDVTVSTTGIPLEIVNAVEAGYETDQWLLTAIISPDALRDAGVEFAYLDGAIGVVNTPVGTTAQPEMAEDPSVAACVDDLEQRTGRTLPYALDVEINDLTTGLYACAMARVLEAGLRGAGIELTNQTFRAGLEGVGPIGLPGYTDARLEPGDLGAARGLELVRFDAAAGAWEPLA